MNKNEQFSIENQIPYRIIDHGEGVVFVNPSLLSPEQLEKLIGFLEKDDDTRPENPPTIVGHD